jgi:hypothetical protein
MRKLNGHRMAAGLASLWLLIMGLAGGVLAQPAAGPGATATTVPPASLRLAQVVPRLPGIYYYAVAQDEAGGPMQIRPSDISALVGSERLPVAFNPQLDADPVAIVFLVDISASLGPAQVGMIKKSLHDWIASLGGKDRAALVTLGENVKTVVDFTPNTPNKATLSDEVAKLVFRDQRTLLYQGMVRAIDLSKRLDESLPLRRAIIVLTDGMDDQQGGAGRQDVLDKLAIDPTPIYGIGASREKSPRVDEALKEFGAIVRASGGEFRRVEVNTLDQGYRYLQGIIAATRRMTARCDGCIPDGSTIVTRLYMTQGTTSLSSGSVTVRAVNEKGEVVVPPPSPPPPQPVPQPVFQPPPKPWYSVWWTRLTTWIAALAWQWLVLAAIALAVVVAGLVAFFLPKPTPALETTRIYPEPGPTRPNPDPNGVIVVQDAITPGTQLEAQRLRITPLGHNDVPAQERVFTEELTVGRSQDNQISIYNDTQVSTKHCTLAPKNGLILVSDEGSRNGTRVNGVPIEQFMHAEADSVLGVGRTELRMQLLAPGRQ